MYRIFIETTDIIAATFAVTIFLGIFAFSQYVGIGNYNFVTPYTYNLTHGVVLSFFTIYAYVRYLKQRKTIWLGIVGLSIGLVFLCKIEVFLAISLSMFTGILLFSIIDKSQLCVIIKRFVVFFIGFLLPIIFFILFLLWSIFKTAHGYKMKKKAQLILGIHIATYDEIHSGGGYNDFD